MYNNLNGINNIGIEQIKIIEIEKFIIFVFFKWTFIYIKIICLF